MGKFFTNQCRELLNKFFIVAVGDGDMTASITRLDQFIKSSFDRFLLAPCFLKQLKGTRLTSFPDHTDIEESDNSPDQFAETPIFDQIINLGQNKEQLRLRLVGRDHIDYLIKIEAFSDQLIELANDQVHLTPS